MRIVTAAALVLVLCLPVIATAQMITRTDAIWARKTTSPITLDGKLDEAAWATAESLKVTYGVQGARPGSGWSAVSGNLKDSTRATLKFLVAGDSLYMAAIVPDSSVGGADWEQFDAFLLSIRKHELTDRPSPSFEYFYVWVLWDPATQALGASPGYFGHAGGNRTDSTNGVPNWSIWDAVTRVQGTSNSDTTAGGALVADTGYVVEFKFNLAARGYNPSAVNGDIVEMTVTLCDADWYWTPETARRTTGWTWFQGRWGGDPFYNVARIHVRPNVTTSSGPVPVLGPDVVIPNGVTHAPPVIDGNLTENVWANVTPLKLEYGNSSLRASYPNNGPYRSGQYQPTIDTVVAPVLDPALADVRYFFRGDTVYVAFDVKDQVLTRASNAFLNEWVRVTVDKIDSLNASHVQQAMDLTVFVVDTGVGYALGGYLPYLKDSVNGAWVGVKKYGTFNNTATADTGYKVEMAFDLKKLGYPAGRGDGILYFGVTVHDGDSVGAATENYANKVFFFREGAASDQAPYKNGAAPAWGYMNPSINVPTGVDDVAGILPVEFAIVGNYPNPFNPSTKVQFTMPEGGEVKLNVYDILGRRVRVVQAGYLTAGVRQMEFSAAGLSSGVYFYNLEMVGSKDNYIRSTSYGKMVFVK